MVQRLSLERVAFTTVSVALATAIVLDGTTTAASWLVTAVACCITTALGSVALLRAGIHPVPTFALRRVVLLFVAFFICATAWAALKHEALASLSRVLVITTFATTVLALLARAPERTALLARNLGILVVATALLALAMDPGGAQRLHRPFGNASHLAAFLLLGAPLTWTFYLGTKGRTPERLLCAWAAFGIVLYALMATQGRAALLIAACMAIPAPLLLAHPLNLEWRWRGVVAITAACIGLTTALPGSGIMGRLHELTSSAPWAPLLVRLEVWRASFALLKSTLPWGVGPGGFGEAFRIYQPPSIPEQAVHAHNEYLEAFIEWGPLGFVLFATLAVGAGLLIGRGMRRIGKPGRSSALLALTTVGLLGAGAHATTNFELHAGANLLWFVTIACLAITASASARGVRHVTLRPLPRERRAKAMLSVYAFLGASLIGVGLAALTAATNGRVTSAHRAATHNRTQEAADSLRSLIRFMPWDWKLWKELAWVQFAGGEDEASIASFTRAQALNPTDPALWIYPGRIHSRRGEAQRAIDSLEHAHTLAPWDPEPLLAYVEVLLRHGELARALDVAGNFLKQRPKSTLRVISALFDWVDNVHALGVVVPDDPEAQRQYISLLMDEHAHDSAIPLIESLHAQTPLDPQLREWLIHALTHVGEKDRAVRFLLRWSHDATLGDRALQQLADLWIPAGKSKELLAHLGSLTPSMRSPQQDLVRARALDEMGHGTEARAVLREAVLRSPYFKDTRVQLINSQILAGELVDAIDQIRTARELFPNDDRFLLYLARIHAKRELWDDAARDYQTVIEHGMHDPQILNEASQAAAKASSTGLTELIEKHQQTPPPKQPARPL